MLSFILQKLDSFSFEKRNLTFNDDFHLDHLRSIKSYDDKNVQVLLPSENFEKGDGRDRKKEKEHIDSSGPLAELDINFKFTRKRNAISCAFRLNNIAIMS